MGLGVSILVRMKAVSTPSSRETRVPLSTSVLIVMLLSIPMTAGVHGAIDPLTRVTASPMRVLPAEIACRLRDGIRYEMPTCPAAVHTPDENPEAQIVRIAGPRLPAWLLDLPPPALG